MAMVRLYNTGISLVQYPVHCDNGDEGDGVAVDDMTIKELISTPLSFILGTQKHLFNRSLWI